MADEPLTTCPECGSQIRRVLFPTGIVFKGHGFYKTDHNGNSSPTAVSSEGDGKKSETEQGSKDDTTKTESSSKDNIKKTESSSHTSTSESKSTTTATTK